MITNKSDWNDAIIFLCHLVRDYEKAPDYALTIKLSEEVGEFSEIMLYEMGHLHHKNKKMKDTPAEEAADIINVLVGALITHYPDKSPSQISDELLAAVKKKGKKYAKLIGADDDLPLR